MESSSEGGRKIALEDLSKEELIKKCKGLLTIAQKAKQAKDVLQEENNELRHKISINSSCTDDATSEIIENLTQQKLLHVTTIEDLKNQNVLLGNKLESYRETLQSYEEKNNSLDSENIAFKRQVNRLTDENEQLITHLDSLERQIEEFKKLGLQQQNELLAFEKNNKHLQDANLKLQNENPDKHSAELQNMLSVSLEEVKKLKHENAVINEKMESLKINLLEKDKNILTISEELQKSQVLVASLEEELRVFKDVDCTNNDIETPAAQNAKLIESNKTLEDTVEKLKDKLRLYHSKIVKFAGNAKTLREKKNEIIEVFKIYTIQVEDWKLQLTSASEKLLHQFNELKSENVELLKENHLLQENNTKFLEQLKAHKTDDEKSKEMDEIENIKSENMKLKEEIRTLLLLQDNLKSELEQLTSEKEGINIEFINLTEQHQREIEELDAQSKKDTIEIQSRKEENEKLCLEYRKIITKLEENIDLNVREIQELQQKNKTLQEDLTNLKVAEKQFCDQTNEEIKKLLMENSALIEQNRKMTQERIDAQNQTDDSIFEGGMELVANLKRENAELLAEMNEMNQALKERGETISHLEVQQEKIVKKLQVYETQANQNVDNISQKEEIIKNLQMELATIKKAPDSANLNDAQSDKDALINQLRTEIDNLKERINANFDTSYAESENMSTSTISRTEESNRLKDLEGSWEERYGKLRNLAVKLKGKIRDLTGELAKEQSEKNEIQQKYTNGIKTVATLQAQCDKLEDDLEVSKKESQAHQAQLNQATVDISKEIQKLTEQNQIISALQKEIDELKNEKIATETWKKQISNKVQTFRKELESNKVIKKEYEAKIAKLTSELEAKDQALRAESDCHKQTKNSLEQSNNERKKNSVLNLEMQDYERSVKELSQKLEKKQDEITKLKNQLESQKSTTNALREQNKIVEDTIKELQDEIAVVKSESAAYKKQISEFELAILQKDNKILDITQLLETVRSENEELSTELSKVIADHQKVSNSLKSEKDHLKSQNLGLQQSLRESQDMLKLKLDELSAIQSDYGNYKVRAQSVLRQNQSRDVGLEEKLSEEVSCLKLRCATLESELNDCRQAMDELKKEHAKLEEEKSDANNKNREITDEMQDLKALYDQLLSKHQQTILEHHETVRNLKVHAETLSQCYRQQLSEQEVRHNREIIELQSRMEKAPSPTEALNLPPLSTMHREEGEGSESTESVNKTNLHPVPLERLLGTDNEHELVLIRKQLAEEETKVVHLTALLADTEQDLAKHTQMNKLLKEEIRRQQRSIEREKHAENLEYLKNVVFKFVTLQNGDERTRLVPVLNTILKLSPEETQKLNMVARGDPGIRGWSNYLPLWSSTSKPS